MWIDDSGFLLYHNACMRTVGIRTILYTLIMALLSLAGCASQPAVSLAEPNAPAAPAQTVYEAEATTAEVIDAADHVLTRMGFAMEKLDAEQGILRTRPLRGAQFFEIWRGDNASVYDWEEANLQSIRRTVELWARPQNSDTAGLCIGCTVTVQRLSLWRNEVAGSSEAYRIRTSNTAALQQIRLTPQERRGMTWIDLGRDQDLEARVLARVKQRLQRGD
jgi:hypothetical protein